MLFKISNSFFYTQKVAYFVFMDSSSPVKASGARRGGTEVAGWTLDRKIRVRFPAYPHRVWALWWQGGKRRLRTSRCPCRGRLGTLKTPSCPWRGCPVAGQNLETGHLSRHYIAEISLNVTLTTINNNNKAIGFNPLSPDLLTLYRRPNPIKIWPTYALPPTTTMYPRSTYDLWRAISSPTIFQPVEKLIPLTTTSQSGPDQSPLYFRPTYALPDQGQLIADPYIFPEWERAGVDRVSGVNGPLGLLTLHWYHMPLGMGLVKM